MFKSFTVILALIVCLAGTVDAARYKIMIVTWRGCEEACQGFQDYLAEHAIDALFIMRDAQKKKEPLPGFLAEARNEKVDLILTWGTSVTRGIVGTLPDLTNQELNHDIATVFMIVADPVGAGIVESLDHTGRPNVTGTYNRVPEETIIETIRSYMQNFKRLGLLFNADEENSVLKRDEIAALAGPMSFELVARELPLDENGKPHVEDIARKVSELKKAGVDFIYLGSSSFLRDNKDIFTDAAVNNGLPVLSPYENMVHESQALLSVAARYYDVGRLAGQQAEKILVGNKSPGDLPVLRMTDFAIVINMGVARKLKLFPPIDLLQIAETVN